MALTVEDGSIVANADSYIDVAYLDAYATARGSTLPDLDADKEKLAIVAMDYIESFAERFKGSKYDPTNQVLSWPRKNVYLDSVLFAYNDIPEQLKRAQCELVVQQQAGITLFPTPVTDTQQGIVTKEDIGPLSVQYANVGAGRNVLASRYAPIPIAVVNIHLNQLIKSAGAIQVTRA